MGLAYGSVCSGIEAATMAWHPLGWEPAFFSEIEKFPCAVLAHHYPHVPNHGDMTKFQEWPDHAIDLLVGGTPCQSFSVAGLRAGLADPRGNLMLTYLAIASRYRPRWLVWENVPALQCRCPTGCAMTRTDYWDSLYRAGTPSKPMRACNCIGPQRGAPACPCRMQNVEIKDGRYVEVIDLGPAPTNREGE